MQVRFVCPACERTHVADVPETTIYMTCAVAHKVVRLRLTAGGDIKTALVGQDQEAAEGEGGEE